MSIWPRQPPEQAAASDNPRDACERMIASVRDKADRNEHLARWTTGTILISSAGIPLSLVASEAGHPFLWGKLLPAVLAVLAAVAAGILQFERPHERWKLYRGYQRLLEDERFRYQNKIEPYEASDDDARLQLLGRYVSSIQTRLHQDWSGLLPASADIAGASTEAAKPPTVPK